MNEFDFDFEIDDGLGLKEQAIKDGTITQEEINKVVKAKKETHKNEILKAIPKEVQESILAKQRAYTKKELEEEIKELPQEFKDEMMAKQKALDKENKAFETKKANAIVIDIQNPDDRKKLQDFYNEGRMTVDIKDKAFICAEQKYPVYNPAKPPIHKIYLHEIESIIVRTYYMDLIIMPAGKRTLVKKVIWCHHKGFTSCSMIEESQLEELLLLQIIPSDRISYVHNDCSTGQSFFVGNNSKEPSKQLLDSLEKTMMKNHLATSNKVLSSKDAIGTSIEEEGEKEEEKEEEEEVETDVETNSDS